MTNERRAEPTTDENAQAAGTTQGSSSLVSIRKSRAASVAHGRGRDSYRTPAGYDIVIDNVLRGRLLGKPQRFMSLPEWEVYAMNPDGSNIRSVRPMLKSKQAAIDWINSNISKLIS